jgi:hypothetical protein
LLLQNTYNDGTNYIYKYTGAASYYQQSAGQHVWVNAPSGTAGNAATFTQAMTLNASGNLGIGATSPGARLHLETSDAASGVAAWWKNQQGDLGFIAQTGTTTYGAAFAARDMILSSTRPIAIFTDLADPIKFGTNQAERMRIDSSGNLLVGTTSVLSSNRRLQVDGASIVAAVFKNSASANEVIDVWNSATSGDNVFIEWQTDGGPTARGTVTYNRTGGLVAYNTTSDYRAKDIAGPIEDASSTVLSLKPYMGTMKGATVERPMFVAHEVQDVAPYAVTGEKDAVDQDGNPKYQQMDHSALVPLLTAALQEALNKIEALEARITALEA